MPTATPMKISLSQALSLLDRQKEKQKDYRNVVIIQIVIIGIGLTLSQPLLQDPESAHSKLIISVFSLFGALYAFLLWDLLRNFTRSRALLTAILITLAGITLMGILGEFPYYRILEIQNRRLYLMLLHGLLFPIEVTVIGFAIRDIFSGGTLTPDKLWGAACIYLMIGISFGSLYDLITIVSPGALGADIPLGLPNYAECVTLSLSILGGGDGGFPAASKLIRNISVLEALWGNLYAILIIGKLLGLPRAEEPEKPDTNIKQP